MTAENVFVVAKHLSQSELHRLFHLIEKELKSDIDFLKAPNKIQDVISEAEALKYLINNVFKRQKQA